AVVVLADLEDGDDMRVVDAGGEASFIEEHPDELFLGGEVGVEALDGDEALEAAGAGEASEVDGGHAAGRELADELIAVELPLFVCGVEELDLGHRDAPYTVRRCRSRARRRRGR